MMEMTDVQTALSIKADHLGTTYTHTALSPVSVVVGLHSAPLALALALAPSSVGRGSIR